MLIKEFKWIFSITCIYAHLSNHVTVSQDFVFPVSDEDARPQVLQKSSWVLNNQKNQGGIKTVKTSSRITSVNEPMALQQKSYNTGSSSQANSRSMIYNFQPGIQQPSYGSGSYASASSSSFSSGGKRCTQPPKLPGNAGMKCAQGSCQITCLPDFKFPNGVDTLSVGCVDGRWMVKSFEFNEIPSCEPVCMPKCLNNGICIAPGQCKCPENFMGPSCQMEKKLCNESPPLPANSRRTCTSSLCTVTCMRGYKFPDASLTMNLLCKSGNWVPEREEIQIIPDCEPTCEPACQNGGTCLSYNVCQCASNFRGRQCQYSITNCAPTKLGFNGAYNCSSSGDLIGCKLWCPKGVTFEYDPASEYVCNFAIGEFLPKQVPKCVYEEGVEVVHGQPMEVHDQRNGSFVKWTGGSKNKTKTQESDSEEDEEVEETVITQTKITKKKKKNKTKTWEDENEFFQTPGVFSMYLSQDLQIKHRVPKPSICMLWNGNKIKTFDGVTYTHELFCSHVVVQDFIDSTFKIILRSCPYDSIQPCPHAIEVFHQTEQFTFENVNGQIKMFTVKKEFSIPIQISGLKVTRSGLDVRIVLESIPLTITWDSKKFVQIDASASIFNRTAGICGTMDGIMSNDFMSNEGKFHKMPATFVDSWRALNMDKTKAKCTPRSQKIESQAACKTSVEEEANFLCPRLLENPKMDNCFKMFNVDAMMKNCISDHCDCKNALTPAECICNGISVLAKDCRFRGIMLDNEWRDWQICPLNCTNGRIYKSCGPLNEPSCGSAIESDSLNCREGCFCPDGTMLNDGLCVKKEMCPCKLKGKAFPANSEIKRDCNTCTCVDGNWECSSESCGSRCSSVGDPHYSTFDGKRYDFMGKCSYYLMKTDQITVEAENVACSGAVSESMNFLPSFTTELPSCTKSVTIKFNDNAGQMRIIKLKQGGIVLLDGFEVSKLPWELDDGAVVIRRASSCFILVDFHDGVQVWWDGATRTYIDAPASYRGKTQGLCGTFNSNMQDDFFTPEGDVETTVHAFANKWQTKESCDFISDKIIPHPCQTNPENNEKAKRICSKLVKDKVFEECHLFVDSEPFYEDCLYDVCACKGDISQCACPILAAYAAECARQGTILNWRYQVAECAVNCPNGQVFDQCGEACTRTCSDLQRETPCKLHCIEGCRCSFGQVLDENNECVMASTCKCIYKGMEFKPGYKEVRPGRKHLELSTCTGGKWNYTVASETDVVKYPAATDISKKCSAMRNEIFTTCVPTEPLTCKNMHLNMASTTALCRAGCTCKDGYVLDTILKQCVLPESCSCHHGGRSFNDGDKIRMNCNTCMCKAGKWACTTEECASTCSLWGDDHFTTFDGREFDFQGVCSYMLSKGKFNDADGFSVTIQNVLCGSNGVTCSKTLTINLVGDEPESIRLSSDSPIPGIKSLVNDVDTVKPLQKMLTYRSGVFLVVEIPHIGVMLKWDRGTRVYLRLENRWKGKVQGLCGNYNYDALDDFLNPSAGIENNPIIFGHSWKLDDSCDMPTEQVDSCTMNPQRKTWSQFKCGLLKTAEFAQCHSEVDVNAYYKRCVHDTCSCDQGGDCECLCTSLAAYAFACSAHGVNIRWRTPDLCPMQCDPTCSNYNPCIESCPVETCDNMMHPLKHERLCKSDNCVEGCKLRECPLGTVYQNGSYADCVPKSACKPICLEFKGITYYEGDFISSDACHNCKCTRSAISCIGAPCITNMPSNDVFGCETGWTSWINQDSSDDLQSVMTSKQNYYKEDDIEPLPTSLQFKSFGKKIKCKPEYYAAIECRTVVGHNHPKMTGQNVECSLERGLVCKGQCFDYEIRVYCDCNDATKPAPYLTSTAVPFKTTMKIPSIPVIPATTPKYSPSHIGKDCNPVVPNIEHPFECNKYLQCTMSQNGSFIYVEQSCGSAMMFNPSLMVCDWPANVIAVKRKCGDTTQNKCPVGYLWSDCAIPCKRACNYYGKVLTINGNCTAASNDCIPGCMPKDAILKCDYPKLWRDWKNCVEIKDCTCFGPNNEQLKPGQVLKISECKTCQCIDNEFICTESNCAVTNIPSKITSTPKVEVVTVGQPTSRKPPGLNENTPKWNFSTRPPGTNVTQPTPPPYYITACDPSVPHAEHPNSCYEFLQCSPMADGSYIFVEKSCSSNMMYNPQLMICDWPDSVIRLKPVCGFNPGRTTIPVYYATPSAKTTTIPSLPQLTARPNKITSEPPYMTDWEFFGTTPYQGIQITQPPFKQQTPRPVPPPYYIRHCDPGVPHIEHPNSCFKFLHCVPSINGGYVYVEKTCYPDMMFNPNTMICDWPDSVKRLKSDCVYNPGEIEVIIHGPITPPTPLYFEECDMYVEPFRQSFDGCHKFLQCVITPEGISVYEERSCGSDLFYNPSTNNCESKTSVEKIKPICMTYPGLIGTPPQIGKIPYIPGIVTTKRPPKLKPTRKPTTPVPIVTKSTLTPLILLPSTVTPPMFCDESKMVPLLHLLPDIAFSSSSNLGVAFKPEAARLESRPVDGFAGSWIPITSNLNQYLQIEFPQPIPIHGVIIRGSPLFSQYVTSFKILYSLDGVIYHVMADQSGNPQIFSGSVDQNSPVKNIFRVPTEAKLIRIYPLSWYEGIALRVELLGCQRDPSKPFTLPPFLTTTTPSAFVPRTVEVITITPPRGFTVRPVQPLCEDPLGVENSQLSPNQVAFSSIKDAGSVKTKVRRNPVEIIKLSSARGWMPLADNVNEYVMFDFMENRNLTGAVTKGGEYGWVKSYTIEYSKDNVIWNKLFDQNGMLKQFIANVDSENIKKNHFPNPINARYLKIIPLKWHAAIELKLEPIGCYLPYPTPDPKYTTSTPNYSHLEIITPQSNCGVCKGALVPLMANNRDTCLCYPPQYWSGSECVPQSDCPCFEGHMEYPVGETYRTENCAECTCKIGGVPQCTPKTCVPCPKGLKRAEPGSCNCKCEMCPVGSHVCQTSGECLIESSWCDGIQDCPDDEINCPPIKAPITNFTQECPEPSCPPGYRIKPKQSRKSKMSSRFAGDDDEDDKPQQQYYHMKATYTVSYEAILAISTRKNKQYIDSEKCFEFMCLPIVDPFEFDYMEDNQTQAIRCPEPKCPRGYMLRLQIQKSSSECVKFTCEPIIENDAVCNVTGRTFNTFDSTEFKYDICSHLLARDVSDEKWNVIMRKNCSTGNNVCTKEIEIRDKVAKYTLILYPSLAVNLDGYYFTVPQLQNSNCRMTFVVSKNGDNLLYVSHTHGIWLTIDQYGDIKLGISSQYANQVDGLCGYYSNAKHDDKRMPNGNGATSTVEFGNSWSISQASQEDCEPHVCPKILQDVALTMCNLVKDDIFRPCTKSINPEHFISTCFETACDCLLTATNGSALTSIASSDFEQYKKQCKCSMLKNYVVECMAADENVHLETWRSVHSCEATCPAPFVHQDCYRRKCEVTCNNLQSAECSNVPGTCFSGCFCPSGTIKKDSTCIPISECRDCVCDGFGKSQYLTFDRKNFTFDGNCTYLLTRDITLTNVHTFQVYATIGPCDTKANAIAKTKVTCTQALHVAYGSHIIHIQKNSVKNLEVIVDGIKLSGLSYTQNWMKISEQGKALSILLPESQVELSTMFEAMSFSLKVPSVKYGNKMEGICGNCNGNPDDDLITNPAEPNMPLTNTPIQNFALSWLANNPKLELNEDKDTCHVDEPTECLPLPPETDPCFKILDDDAFSKCNFVVDPLMYVTACQQDLCRTGPTQKGSCESIAAYARECSRNGICVDWRRNGFCSMECEAPYVYMPCGCADTCQTLDAKQKLIKSSPALKDPKTIEKMKSICKAGLSEGCHCPKGKVLHNGKCIREIECRACDDKGHLPGDNWYLDVCTKCTCQNDLTIQCQKIQCPGQQTICAIGFNAVESSTTGECCKKFTCVPEVKSITITSCQKVVFPQCGVDQTNKMLNDSSGCSKYICDCIPKSQCKPTKNYTSLEPGFKAVIDTTGCCPVSKLICDKSSCPPKPIQCTEAYYVVEKTKSADDKICCDIYECRPPQDSCVATVGDKKMLKKIDEIWSTVDVCVKAQCVFDTNGNPIIKTQREVCSKVCQAGSQLSPVAGECCGECIKTKCIVDNKLFEIGQTWSSADNCTKFECNIKDGQTYISSMMATCPDIKSCPMVMRYKDGCCERCKMLPQSQKNCLPESLAESTTIGLIKVQMSPHGNCRNINGVRGITECVGTCKSGTKFDPLTLHQQKSCECCSATEVRELPVELVCDDNYKFIKHFNVPASCSCAKCGIEEQLNKLRAAF